MSFATCCTSSVVVRIFFSDDFLISLFSLSFYFRLKQVMEYAEDLEIDIPKICTYLAELICPVLADNGLPWDHLTEIAEPLSESKKGGDFIAALLTSLLSTMVSPIFISSFTT